MAKQNARELLVKLGDGGDPQNYAMVAGLTTRNINLNGNLVDVTSINVNDPGGTVWRDTIAGIQSVDVSGTGYFEDKAQTVAFINAKNNGTPIALQIVVPGLGTFEADFAVGNLSISAELEGVVGQNMELQSTGPVTFTQEA